MGLVAVGALHLGVIYAVFGTPWAGLYFWIPSPEGSDTSKW